MDEIQVRNVPMLIAAAGTTALWLLAMLAVRVIRQPVRPEPGPATSDLGPEPPAITNMLVNEFQVKREAVPATLLDLAARGIVDIQGIGDMYAVHLRRGSRQTALTEYEQRVLQLLEEKAEDGVVPAGALTTGPRERARRWWKDFRKDVIADAKSRGLSRDLWSGSVLVWISLIALVPTPFVYLAFSEPEAAIAYGVLALAFIELVREGGRQRDTDSGRSAAARWLGVRHYLRDEPAFPDLPPSAVEIWERHLAYGAAVGAAQGAVRAIPMGAEEDRRAWSAYGGRWREVRIRYPRAWPPGWGWPLWMALLYALPVGAVGVGVFLAAASIGWPDGSLVLGLLVALLGAVGVAAAAWAVAALIGGLADLGTREEVTGLVLRLREYGGDETPHRCYVAVDDGRSSTIRAWRLGPEVYRTAGLSEYAGARATVTRRLRYVREIAPTTLRED